MNEQTMNPYAAPTADVAPTAGSEETFAPFPRFSTWWVFLLTMVTFGIYGYYWLFSRTQVVNKHYPQHVISNGLVWTALSVFFVQLVLGFAVGVMAGTGSADASGMYSVYAVLDPILSIAGLVLWYVWIYTLRGRINVLADAQPGNPLRVGPILTFFFTIFYLSYKINQIKDAE